MKSFRTVASGANDFGAAINKLLTKFKFYWRENEFLFRRAIKTEASQV